MQNLTYAAHFRPHIRKEALLYDIILITGASIFIALSAQIAFNIPFSPVPITGQTFAVLLTGALLGSRRGGLAVLAYLLEGISGLPVFAQAQFGLVHLFGPTGGYLIGFVPAAFLTGLLVESGWGKTLFGVMTVMTVGTIIIFICGLSGLKLFFGNNNVLHVGLYPYLTGAVIKIALAAFVYRLGWHAIDKYSRNEAEL
jgi:biotin transport system substrate-specific component